MFCIAYRRTKTDSTSVEEKIIFPNVYETLNTSDKYHPSIRPTKLVPMLLETTIRLKRVQKTDLVSKSFHDIGIQTPFVNRLLSKRVMQCPKSMVEK